MILVFGGLYSGVYTVDEDASVAAVLSLLFALARRRMRVDSFMQGMQSCAGTAVMLYMILIGASVFTYYITLARLPEALIHGIEAMNLAPLSLIAILLVAYKCWARYLRSCQRYSSRSRSYSRSSCTLATTQSGGGSSM